MPGRGNALSLIHILSLGPIQWVGREDRTGFVGSARWI